MPGVRPEHDAAFWAGLAGRPWRRVRWREGLPGAPPAGNPVAGPGSPGGNPVAGNPVAEARCAAFGTPLHRAGTYYRRPVYTDGALWLSQQGFDEMTRQTGGGRASRQTRPDG